MAFDCDVILRWDATPDQLRTVGASLWRWCLGSGTAAATGVYPYLDNQALSDLIAGVFPAAGRTQRPGERRGVHVRVRDEASRDRRTTIDRLRREMPSHGIEDVLVAGRSWDQAGAEIATGPMISGNRNVGSFVSA
jgi:hypothetical protein